MNELEDNLPTELKSSGKRIPIEYGGNLAWKFEDALRVIEWCERNGISILGGEVYIYSEEPPYWEPTLLTWYVPSEQNENWTFLVKRSASIARSSLQNAFRQGGGNSFFTLDMIDWPRFIMLNSLR
jgi:hypothetical protein